MGLDVFAYGGLAKVKAEPDGYRLDVVSWKLEWIEQRWPGRTEGLESGVYDCAAKSGEISMSYTNYKAWRASLARRVNHREGQPGPFAERIDFPSNEGYIGPVVCAKLARDFAEHEQKTIRRADAAFVRRYRKFRAAFEMAADNGAVGFF